MIVRVAAAQAVLDRHHGRDFAWGERDCVRIGSDLLTELGIASPLARARSYRNEAGAVRALGALGFDSLSAAVDSIEGLTRIGHASALPADLVAFKSALAAFDVSIGVVLSRGHALALLDDADRAGGFKVVVLDRLDDALFAWRVSVG